jgi:polyphenol oxidase
MMAFGVDGVVDKRVAGDAEPGAVRVLEWEGLGWLRHGFSTRQGGVSSVYAGGSGVGELNLGWTKEDDPVRVAENRRWFSRSITGESGAEAGWKMVTLRQVHSDVVRVVREGDGALEGRLETEEGKAVWEGDGLISNVPGVLLAIQTADCVPVMVVDVAKRAVGVFHAGWRGTLARIVERGVDAMRAEYGTRPEDLVAAVGPSIGECCYVVGEEVRAGFESGLGYLGELFRELDGTEETGRQWRLDLWEANRRQLVGAGVSPERVVVVGECTGCAVFDSGEKRYFSHRVERGVAGRMLSVAGIEP